MDIFQIGELTNQLSDELKFKINKRDLKGIVDTRNIIGHGYIVIKNDELWKTIHIELPNLIKQFDELFE